MKPNLPLRIIIPLFLLLSALVAGAVSLLYLSPQRERKVETENVKSVRLVMHLLQSSVNILLRRDDYAGIKIQLTSLAADNDTNIILITDDQGKVLIAAHENHQGKLIGDVAPFMLMRKASPSKEFSTVHVFLSEDRNSVRAVYPVILAEQSNRLRTTRFGKLIFEKNIEYEKIFEQNHIEKQVGVFLLLMLMMSGLMWLIFHFLITNRARLLVEFTNEVALGNFSARNGLQGKDEFAQIGEALIEMAGGLDNQRYDLTKSELRLRKSQVFANMGNWEWEVKSGDWYWSEMIAPMFGLEIIKDEVNYDLFISCIHPADRDMVALALAKCLQERKPFDIQHRIMQLDGNIRWMHQQGYVVLDENGTAPLMLGVVRDITQQKLSELQLEGSIRELNYQKYAVDQHCIVAVTDITGKITYSNEKFVEISGYSKNELLSKTHNIINSGIHTKEFFVDLWATISHCKVWRGEICNRNKNGELYWVATTIVPYVDENGSLSSYIAIRTDITQRVLAEQLVKDERELLEMISKVQSQFIRDNDPLTGFEILLQAVLSVSDSEYGFVGEVLYDSEQRPYLKTMALTNIAWDDPTRALYEKNAAAGMEFTNLETLFGQAMETGQPVIANDPTNDSRRGGLPEGHPALKAFLGVPLYVGDHMVGMVGIANRPAGYSEALLIHLQPLFNACGRIINAYREDRIRKQVENELTRFKTTLDKTLDCVFMFDPESLKYFYVNQGATELVGYSQDELMQMTPCDLIPEFDQAHCRKMIAPFISRPDKTENFEVAYQHKDGRKIPVEISLQYVTPTGERSRFVIFVRDISERQYFQKQLQQAQKMETIGQLAGGIAHDFNNMLSSILGFTELARGELTLDKDEKIDRYLSQVYTAGTRARQLVAQMSVFSRGSEGERNPHILAGLVKESLKMLGATLPSSIEIDLQLDENELTAVTNPVQLHQLIMNLCINARDAMAGKGHITIGLLSVNGVEADCCSCHERIRGDYIKLFVRDSGSGMNPEQLDRVFEPFYTTKAVGSGTGMGLSMVHGIMHDHGGHIVIETEPGNGSNFNLLFPVIKSPVETVNIEDSFTKKLMGQRIDGNILIVDDEVPVGQFIGELLKRCGCSITVETDSRSALAKFKKNSTKFDLVVTDQTMPGLTGAELAQLLLEIRPELPIVLCTGYSEAVDEAKAKSLGISGFVNKPINIDKFLELIGKLLPVNEIKSESNKRKRAS